MQWPQSTRRWYVVALVLVMVTASACTDGTPATISSYRGDSVVVNGMRPTPIPRVDRGSVLSLLWNTPARWRYVSGDSFRVDDSGRVTCTRHGTMRVETTSGAARKTITVLCRPIANVAWGQQVKLRPGGRSAEYSMGALGPDGRPVLEIAGVATVLDSSVAVLRDGELIAKNIGRTFLALEAGDCLTHVGVEVESPVDSAHHVHPYRPFEDTVTLAPGELKTWQPRSGLTRVVLYGDSVSVARLAFGAFNANCANLREGRRGLSCIMTDSSVIAVRNPFTATNARMRLRIEQPEPPTPVRRAIQSRTREGSNRFCPQRLG